MIRDKETDWLLLQLRTFFNRCNYAASGEHALLMSDWLEERGRPLEAAALRSGRWVLLIMEGHGWPPPCEVVAEYVPGTHRQIYMDSDYITSAEVLLDPARHVLDDLVVELLGPAWPNCDGER